MSDGANTQPREQDLSIGGQAVDQRARAPQDPPQQDDHVPTSDEVIETLRHQIATLEGDRDSQRQRAEAEARARSEAEARARAADEARRGADAARQTAENVGQRSVDEARLDTIKNSLAMHDSQLTQIAEAKQGLLEEGKFNEAKDLDIEMAKIGGRMAQLDAGRIELEERLKAPPPPAPAAGGNDQTQPSPAQQRESFIRQQPELVQQWLRGPNGDRFFTDPAFQARVADAARYAQNVRGIPVNSQDYLDFVEESVGLRQPAQQHQPVGGGNGAGNGTAQPRGREADDGRRMIAAPAGGSAGGSIRSNADGSTHVYLTPEERAFARQQGVSEVDYARHKKDLINEGLIGPGARSR